MRSVWQCYDALASDGDASSASKRMRHHPPHIRWPSSVYVPVPERFPIAPSWPPQLGQRRGDGGDDCQCDEPNTVGMNRMIGTEAGPSVQTKGTMVRLPNNVLQTAWPNFSFSCPLLSASIDSTRHCSSLKHTYISSERNFSSHFAMAPRGILSTPSRSKTIRGFNGARAYIGPTRSYDTPRGRVSPCYELFAQC